jgi:hypothetical protein
MQNRKMFQIVTIFAVVIFLVSMIPGKTAAAQSSQITFRPVADAYVSQSTANTNYGTNDSLRVDNSPVVRSYLRFDVSGINGSPVQSARLRIYANSSNSSGYSVNAESNTSWIENKITYSNAPGVGAEINRAGPVTGGKWIEVDVTKYVKADGATSLVLVGLNSTNINLASRESGGNAPQLVVTTAVQQIATSTNPAVPTTAPTQAPADATTPTNSPTQSPTDLAIPTSTPIMASGTDLQPSFPIRAAFYYPWFPEGWNQAGFNPFTNYHPTLGYYSSNDLATVQKQIDMMQYGGIQAGIASWWGQGSNTDVKMPNLLKAAAGTPFRWAIYYENESQGNPSASQIQSDLTYIRDHYGKDPAFLRVNGKFVVFVYADTADACGMADRWKQANTVGAYIVLKVFPGYGTCASQPDSWHQYAPAVATDQQGSYSYVISPGFWKKGETVRLARDPQRWASNVDAWSKAAVKWQLVTTFNEWGEGTSVEPAQEWASNSGYGFYLDILHVATSGGALPPASTQVASLPTSTPAPTQPAAPQPTATNPPAPSPTQPAATQAPASTSDPIIFFQGDLVSGSSLARGQKVVALIKNLMAQHAGTKMLVASTGDNEQENNPTVANYEQYFGTTYGAFVSQGIFMQIRGNHDIQSEGAYTDYDGTTHASGAAYWTYFGNNSRAANISGKKLTDYSFDLGAWHFVALDQLNGSVNTATLNFMKADLAAHPNTCQLVYWHVPTYSSGSAHGDATGLIPFNQAEYDAGVDIQINGHDHHYQRFYPINPSGVRDDARGITTFIDGIGGQDGRAGSKTSIAQAASAIFMDAFPGGEAIGTIMFTLHSNSADYKVYDANDGSIVDSGTVTCH